MFVHMWISTRRSDFKIWKKSWQRIETFKGKLDVEIVAFPQHGLLVDETIELLKKALSYDLVKYVGGVDPASVDGNIEKSLQTMVTLAKDHGVGIDLHLHDADYLGTFTMKRLAQPRTRSRA